MDMFVTAMFGALFLAYGGAPPDQGAADQEELAQRIHWQVGPTTARVGNQAEIFVPAGYQLTDADGSRIVAQLTENLYGDQCATLVPVDFQWVMSFTFDPSGRVDDQEGAPLDSIAILQSLQQATLQSNAERARHGFPHLFVDAWVIPPRYNQQTRRLEWTTRGHSDRGDEFANFNTRVLGRHGVMHVRLVAATEQIRAIIPKVNSLLDRLQFTSGNRYAEWRSGDKVAGYGLTALITGGGVVIAAKSGWLNRLGPWLAKGLGVATVAVLAWIGSLFTRKKQGAAPSTSVAVVGSCLVHCHHCGQKLRLPGQQGRLVVTCPNCGHQFEHAT